MTFYAKQLSKTLVKNPPPLPSLHGVKFGTLFTPHMVDINAEGDTWSPPRIVPKENFSMPPQSSCLHYALQCFEGLKAYRDAKGNIRLFRPDRNCARMLSSMQRLCFPAFDPAELLDVLKEYIRVERPFIPSERGYSLYLRPTAIGTGAHLAAAPSPTTKLFVIASPVGPYYASGLRPVRLLVEETRRRAAPGGTGAYKLGANYAAPMLVQREASARGFEQVLWLADDGAVQEVGAMNFMCVWRRGGEAALVTAPLDGTILPGITRDAVLALARADGEMGVAEERFTIHELVEALRRGEVLECFGTGTAAIVSPICALQYEGVEYAVPCPNPEESVAHKMMNRIMDIQYGVVDHEWSVVVPS